MTALAAAAGGGTGLTGLAGFVADTIVALGAVGVGLLVLVENLFPPIPSEVVLPLAGFLAGQGQMRVGVVIVAATAGSVAGALLLYGAGARLGRRRLRAIAHRLPLVEVADLDRAEAWFARHGGRAVLIGRVIPVVRSLISVPAGVERMPVLRFTAYTALGSAAYNTVLVGGGYLLGSRWTDVGRYSSVINYVVYAALAVAVAVFAVRRTRTRRRRAGAARPPEA